MLKQKPIKTPGGSVRIVDSTNFPISKTIAAALVEVEPGGMRELHWHPNNDEWQYYLTGEARMTVFLGNGEICGIYNSNATTRRLNRLLF
ncbi:cupin domain-containing protein [Bacillus sp. HC-Mk]